MDDQRYSLKRSLGQFFVMEHDSQSSGYRVTERCNNACIHCYINLPQDHARAIRRELTTDQWKDILQQAADLGALSIRFTGGEPLLRDDFEELYLFTRKLGMKVLLFTNGRLITPALADLWRRIPPLQPIEISVYGITLESYEAVSCCAGSFSACMRGVNLLKERGIPFYIKSTRLPPNSRELGALEQWSTTVSIKKDSLPVTLLLNMRARRDSSRKNHLISSMRLSPEEVVAHESRYAESYQKYVKYMMEYCTRSLGPKADLLFLVGLGIPLVSMPMGFCRCVCYCVIPKWDIPCVKGL